MRTGALYFPAVYPDAMQPGEYHRQGDELRIACVACGYEQAVTHLDRIHPCESQDCPAMFWIELLRAAS